MKALRVLPFLLCTAAAQAQTTYTQTLPLMQSVYSWHSFDFTGTPPTTGPGTLSCQWLACWMSGFGGNDITIQFQTGASAWEDVLYQDGNYQECTYIPASSTVPGPTLAAAIAYGGGTIHGRVRASDNCVAGMGCAFSSDPNVNGLTLSYTAHAANFTTADPSVCPGSTVSFTDLSINTPSSYEWIFEGGVPGGSAQQNPTVQYPTSGSYDVTLIVETGDGMDTLELSNYITVHDLPPANAGVDEDVCAGQSAQLQASGGSGYQWFPATGLNNDQIAAPMATPTETTSYTVLVTDANGCQASDFMILTVHALPTVVASAGNNTICLGDTANIVAIGAQLYTWSPNLFISGTSGASVAVWPTSDFTWTVTGTDGFGCVNDATVTIEVEPPPPAPTVTNTGMQVSSTAASGYQWFLNGDPIPGATQQSWSPVVNGNYSVVITDANGCQSQSLPVYFGTVGVVDAAAAGLRIFPQPADEVITISGVAAHAVVRLLDASGRVALTKRMGASGTVMLDVRALAPGSYVIEVGSGSAAQRMAVVVE
jgi:PKD repeat protein